MNTQTDYRLKKNTLFKHELKNNSRTPQLKKLHLWRSFWYEKYVPPSILEFAFLSWDSVDKNHTFEA